jgi:hypothetical protein
MSDIDTTKETVTTTPATTDTEQLETKTGQTATEPSFTQDDVNRLVGKTRKEAREAAKLALLEELGIDDLSAIKTVLKQAKEREDAELSETQKLERELQAERQRAAQIEADMQRLRDEQVASKREAAFKQAVTKAGGQDVNRLFILVNAEKSADFTNLFDEQGVVDDKSMDAFIKQVQADYSNYFATAGAGSPSNAGGIAPSSQTNQKDLEKELKRKFGKL